MRDHHICSYRTTLASALLATGLFLLPRAVFADSFDWRNVAGENWNTSAKSQFGGTCWDFGPSGALEAKYKLTRDDASFDPDISEQQICWETSPDMGSTQGGGGFDLILNYFTTHGVVSEEVCPVEANSAYWDVPSPTDPWPLSTIYPSPDSWTNHVWKCTGWQSVSAANLKTAIKSYGPLVIGFNADDLYSSVADLKANYVYHTPTDNHSVSLVGYADDPTCPTGGYWIIKNSWGTGTGESGFQYVPYNSSIDAGLNHLYAINGPAYHTGPMASVTWNGGTGTWVSGGTNWTGGYAWENKESSATFSGAGGAVSLSGKVIAHGLTISTGATGYVFNGVDNPSLTITIGGITANESVAINSAIKIGGPQTWTVASGKTLTIGGDLHTIISPLTIAGSGDTVLAGSIDGGGAANVGGIAPGTITKTSTGVLHFTGAGTYAVPLSASGSISFEQSGTVAADYSGRISGSCTVLKSNPGTIIFSGTNNSYTGTTFISAGALEANSGAGLPNGSFLNLSGGVIQSHGTATVTFSRTLGSSGSGKFRFNSNGSGGGFAAGEGPMTVRINNNTNTINWGTSSTNINGTLKFGSLTAANTVTLLNGINLNGSTRTIEVVDNPNSTADRAEISGVITYGSGTAGIRKTGDGLLILSGANTYNGTTTISGGALQVDEGVGLPAGRMLVLDGGVLQNNSATVFDHSLGAFQWTANGGGFSAGNGAMTVNIGGGGATLNWGAGVGNGIMGTLKFGSPTANYGVTFQNGINLNGGARTVAVDGNTATLTGVISDSVGGGSLSKTGAGTLVLPVANTFSGNLVVSGGTLVGTVMNAFGPMSPSRSVIANAGGTLSLGVSDMLGTYASTSIPAVDLEGGALTNAAGTHQAFNALTLNNGTLLAAGDAGVPGSGGWGTWNLNGTVVSHGASAMIATDANATVTLRNGDVASPSTTFNVADGALTVSLPIYDGIDGHTTGGSYLLHATALVKTGAGTLALNAVNRYSGGTTINGGLISTDNLATGGGVCGIGGGTSVAMDGGGLLYTGASAATFDRTIMLGAGGGLLGSSGGNLTCTTAISGSGGFTFQGSGVLTLSGSGGNTYSGATTVSGGKLVLAKTSGYALPGDFTLADAVVVAQNANQFPTTAAVTFTGAGGSTLEVYGRSVTVGGISGSGVIENTETETGVGSGSLVVNNSANCTFSGTLRNCLAGTNTLSLTKGGAGVLTLVGASTGQYTGTLTVNAGTLDYSGGGLPSGNYTINGGLLNLGAQSKSVSQLVVTGGTLSGSGTITSMNSFNVQGGVIDAVLGGTSSLNKSGSGSATVNSPAYTGNTIVQAGRLTFTGGLPSGNYYMTGGTLDIGGMSKSIRTFQLNGGTVTGGGTLTMTSGTYTLQAGQVDVTLGGANTVSKSTAGTVVFTGANTYTGQTNLTAGGLQVHNVSALGTTAGKTVVSSGAVLSAGGGLTGTINEPLDLNGIGDGDGALQAVDAGTNVTFAGPVSLVSSAGVGGTSPLRISGPISGAAELTKYGANRVTLTGANTYTGRTNLTAGTLELGPAAQNAVLSLGGVDVQSGRLVFDYAGGADPATTIAGLLAASCDGGQWDAGQFRSTTASASGLTLGWLDDSAAQTVTVLATYAGDFNLDGVADATDMDTLVSHLGRLGDWSTGDANYDGRVDLLDWNLWKVNLGRPALGLPVAAIPEPSTLALAFAGLLGLAGYAWRRSARRS